MDDGTTPKPRGTTLCESSMGRSYLCWELQCCTSTEGEEHLQLSKQGRGRLLPVPAEIGLLHFSSTSQPDPCTAPQPAGCTELLTDAQC